MLFEALSTSSSATASSLFSSSTLPLNRFTSASYCSARRTACASSVDLSCNTFFSLPWECLKSESSWKHCFIPHVSCYVNYNSDLPISGWELTVETNNAIFLILSVNSNRVIFLPKDNCFGQCFAMREHFSQFELRMSKTSPGTIVFK